MRIIDALHPDALTDDQKQRIQNDVDTMLIAGIDLADNGMRPLPTARFCHINGFMATSGSREDAIAMAEQALLFERD